MTGRLVVSLAVVAALGLGSVRTGARPQSQASPSAPAAPPTTGTAFVLGRVVDADTGAPVDDAMVTLIVMTTASAALSTLTGVAATGSGKLAGPPRHVLVNGRGQFVFHDLPAGAMLIRATAPGYMPSGPGVEVPGGEPAGLDATAGEHLADVTIRMWRLSSIEGAVVDGSGSPMANVDVRLLKRAGGVRLVGGPSATTDDRGLFRFSALEPGRYYVLVQSTTSSLPASVVDDFASQLNESVSALFRGAPTPEPHPGKPGVRVGDSVFQPNSALARDAPLPARDGSLLIYRTTFYPTAPTATQAQPIDLAAGDDRTDLNLMVPLVHTVPVSGTVTWPPSDPVEVTELRLVPAEAAPWAQTSGLEAAWTLTDSNGAFTFLGVPPGQYVVENRDNYGWVRSSLAVGDAPVTHLVLTEHPKLRVSGQVRFVGSGVGPAPPLGRHTLSLVALTGDNQPAQAIVTPNGQFTFDDCEPGRYLIDAQSLGVPGSAWTIQSITSDGRDLTSRPLDLESDASDVVVIYTDRPTEIAGSAHDPTTSAEPVVVVFPADYQAAEDSGIFSYRETIAAVTAGRFVIDGLPAGRYLVAAIRATQLGIWQDPGPLAKLASQASLVTLTDRAHVTVDLKVVDLR